MSLAVKTRLDLPSGIDITSYTVFGGKKADEIYPGGLEKYIDCGFELRINPRRVRDQSHPLSFEGFETAVTQDLDAGFDPRVQKEGYQQRRRTSNETKTVTKQHSITSIKNPT